MSTATTQNSMKTPHNFSMWTHRENRTQILQSFFETSECKLFNLHRKFHPSTSFLVSKCETETQWVVIKRVTRNNVWGQNNPNTSTTEKTHTELQKLRGAAGASCTSCPLPGRRRKKSGHRPDEQFPPAVMPCIHLVAAFSYTFRVCWLGSSESSGQSSVSALENVDAGSTCFPIRICSCFWAALHAAQRVKPPLGWRPSPPSAAHTHVWVLKLRPAQQLLTPFNW